MSSSALLNWYDRNRRSLPWRASPGDLADPYHVWISEIMLQQTTVRAVIPYYLRFLERFPTLSSLAGAPVDDVLVLWAGLGYYSRARNLHRCAQVLVENGGFPRDVEGLKALPGIGAYTAAAIAAIAFGIPVVPVDGNVERVTARVFAVEAPLPGARKILAERAATLNMGRAARNRPSDFAQALFDLGAGICTPRSPACVLCPWQDGCAGRKAGIQALLPYRAPKADRPARYGVHFLLTDDTGRILMRRRPSTGLLGGTVELPGTDWRSAPWPPGDALPYAPFAERAGESERAGENVRCIRWESAGSVKHVFTHFSLSVAVQVARLSTMPNPDGSDGFLVRTDEMQKNALSSLMKKCVQTGLEFLGEAATPLPQDGSVRVSRRKRTGGNSV
nr:A/G-specific adenine glycosylase [Acetobacter musti]